MFTKTLLQIAQRRHRRRHHFSAPPTAATHAAQPPQLSKYLIELAIEPLIVHLLVRTGLSTSTTATATAAVAVFAAPRQQRIARLPRDGERHGRRAERGKDDESTTHCRAVMELMDPSESRAGAKFTNAHVAGDHRFVARLLLRLEHGPTHVAPENTRGSGVVAPPPVASGPRMTL